ncbi:MAG: leucine-rich repeat domain-containing protein, partial [Clostridia bacterium]|nr:leucine-rich repeat domain-containing protein [Clostridia bacterium]
NLAELKNIDLGDTIESIGANAFYRCRKLESIVFTKSLAKIDSLAFSQCTSLASVTIPESVDAFGNKAFSGCTALREVVFSYGVETIGTNSFSGCTSLTSVTIPATVKTVGDSAFSGCTALTDVLMMSGVGKIGNGVFSDCPALSYVVIPDSIRTIGENTFKNCTGLSEIIIISGVTEIKASAFSGCSSLDTVYYSGEREDWNGIAIAASGNSALLNADIIFSYTLDDYGTFGDDDSWTWTIDEDGVLTVSGTGDMPDFASVNEVPWRDHLSSDQNAIVSVNVTSGVTHIGAYAFCGCTQLESVTLPRTASSIGDYAFADCVSLEEITMPGNIERGDHAFSDNMLLSVKSCSEFNWQQDHWRFDNDNKGGTNSGFKTGSYRYSQLIDEAYTNVLKENLTNKEKKKVFYGVESTSGRMTGYIYKTWEGSCYGMSSLVLLAKAGLLPYSEYTNSGKDYLYGIYAPKNNNTLSKKVSSLTTYYQMIQYKDPIQVGFRTTPLRDNKDNIDYLLSELDKNGLVLVCYKKSAGGGHAVVAYDYELGDQSFAFGNTTIDLTGGGVIKICDPNFSHPDTDTNSTLKKHNIYFGYDEDGLFVWAVPSGSYISDEGAVFAYIGADIDEINNGGYLKSASSDSGDSGYVARVDVLENNNSRLGIQSVATGSDPGS